MPYADPFDVTTPTGAAAASQGDDRIRELKRAISERLDTFFTNWPDGEPLEANAEATGISVGLLSARPNPPAEEGLIYWAKDTDELYVSVETDPDVFVWEGPVGASEDVQGGALGYKYQSALLTAAARKGDLRPVGETIHLTVIATTSVIGNIAIKLTDFNVEYDSTKVIAALATCYSVGGAPRYAHSNTLATDPADDYWYFLITVGDGSALLSTAVVVHVTLVMEQL